MSTEGPINDQNFTVIPNSNFASYDPPYTTQSTWYRRRAKGAGCPEFLSVSNEIAKIVEDCSSQSPDLYTPGINYLACTVSSFHNDDFAISLENEGEYAFDDEGGVFTVYDNGTARIEGVIEYINDNSHGYGYGYGGHGHGHGYGHHCNNESKWRVTLWLKNRRNWNEWSAMGRNYRAGGNAANHTGWDYYELDTDRSVFVGMGHSSDEIVYLTPNPANYSYGFQVGDGANDKNSDFGISGTFNFASNSSDFNGSGQINTRQECEIICSPEIASTEEEITHFATNEHALWIVLPGTNQGPERNYQFDSNGGKLTRYNDKTGLITGRVENLGDPSKKYRTEIWLINARSWEEWSEMGRGYKDGGDGSNHEDWEYFEIDRNHSRLIGEGANQGDTLFLTHMPSDFYYGVQIGWGANDKTTDYGLSGWFEFSGAETGHGDINMNIATTEAHYASSVTYVCKGSGFNPNGHAVNFNNYRVSGQNLNDFVFDSKGARFSTYNNYTAKIEGDIFHPSRPGQQWHVCLWLNAKQDWLEWAGIGKTYLTGNASLAITEEMHTVWDYYSLNTEKSLLTGRGENTGDTLFLSLDSHTYNYGFQVGPAANGKNDDYGSSGWFDYSSASGNFSGIASINLNLHCNEYCAATPRIAVRAMLEGPYNAAARRMNTNLNNAGVLPLTQPYSASPWDYAGAESVPFIPNSNIVDWVLVEVRDGEDSTRIINSQAAFINKNGYIVGLNGSSYLEMELGDNTQNYYVVVIHRNHLSIMTRLPIGREGRIYFEDFTESMNKAFSKIGINNDPMHVNTGVHLMIAGDSDGSSIINSVDLQKGVIGYFLPGYNNFDTNMSLIANSVDLWRAVTNYFERSHVPSATR
ncbi:MAG: hypothetical protein SF052_01535 [Bacteroidia bacterium]|nr:hypothetical protein [Bacteroidia bacterium]